VEGSSFDESELFRAIAGSGARALLIGRRALVVLGVPVLTADYDYWIHADDAAKLNAALAPLDMVPSHSPDEARKRGRYVIENGDRIDVLVARQQSTKDGVPVRFDDVWTRKQRVRYADGVDLFIPAIDDLILTKRWAMRPKDVTDIQHLESLRRRSP
jgi:hypothetical protein